MKVSSEEVEMRMATRIVIRRRKREIERKESKTYTLLRASIFPTRSLVAWLSPWITGSRVWADGGTGNKVEG